MDAKKVLKGMVGVTLYGVGVVAELAKFGLHVADVFVCGQAVKMTHQMVGGADLDSGKEKTAIVQKVIGYPAALLKKKGKGLLR